MQVSVPESRLKQYSVHKPILTTHHSQGNHPHQSQYEQTDNFIFKTQDKSQFTGWCLGAIAEKKMFLFSWTPNALRLPGMWHQVSLNTAELDFQRRRLNVSWFCLMLTQLQLAPVLSQFLFSFKISVFVLFFIIQDNIWLRMTCSMGNEYYVGILMTQQPQMCLKPHL